MKGFLGLLNLSKRYVRWIVILIVIGLIIWGFYQLFINDPYTTDAYVQGNWIKISARVEGPVTETFVKHNQWVEKGAILFKIDPTDFRLRMKKAEGQLHAINQELGALSQAVKSASYFIVEKKALERYARIELKRMKELVTIKAVSVQRLNKAQATFESLQAQTTRAVHRLEKLKVELGTIITNGKKKVAEAELALAQKQLSYTTIRAPADGYLSNFYLRKGQYIKIGMPVFSIIEPKDWWVQANFLEFELYRIKPGQSATIRMSMYPFHAFKGKVVAIGRGISRGRVISPQNELPAIKESINWLRLFSRFPVFIKIVDLDPQFPLRVGATAAVILHVK